jgi:hypothetical protein
MATRIRNYTSFEKSALKEKLYNPLITVFCPRCGRELLYREMGNSSSAKCSTDGCIYGSIRGI